MTPKTKYRCHIRVGTSGYSYAEWAEAGFYPLDTKPGRMLTCYAQIFPVTELNYTWYQMPKSQAIERMLQQVSPDFQFAAKLIRYLTHEIDADAWRGHVKQYRDGIAPLVQSGQLAAVLLQFPPSFHRVPKNRHYLAALLDELDGLPMAIEFRHVSWATESVYAELRIFFMFVCMAAIPGDGAPETCRSSSITIMPTMNCVNGRMSGSRRWPNIPETA
jgi:uncharacterized protein YecE (DUF72 family)